MRREDDSETSSALILLHNKYLFLILALYKSLLSRIPFASARRTYVCIAASVWMCWKWVSVIEISFSTTFTDTNFVQLTYRLYCDRCCSNSTAANVVCIQNSQSRRTIPVVDVKWQSVAWVVCVCVCDGIYWTVSELSVLLTFIVHFFSFVSFIRSNRFGIHFNWFQWNNNRIFICLIQFFFINSFVLLEWCESSPFALLPPHVLRLYLLRRSEKKIIFNLVQHTLTREIKKKSVHCCALRRPDSVVLFLLCAHSITYKRVIHSRSCAYSIQRNVWYIIT